MIRLGSHACRFSELLYHYGYAVLLSEILNVLCTETMSVGHVNEFHLWRDDLIERRQQPYFISRDSEVANPFRARIRSNQ
jgi:hypothetical protein